MLEWDTATTDSSKWCITYDGVPLPGTVYEISAIRFVHRRMSDSPRDAYIVAKEVMDDILSKGCIPAITENDIAEFLYDHCEDEL